MKSSLAIERALGCCAVATCARRNRDVPARGVQRLVQEARRQDATHSHTLPRDVRTRAAAGFTLAEVLAALVFMAIVVPVAIGALRVASLSGEVAQRKAAAARVADRVLNEAVLTTQGSPLAQQGTATENGRSFPWTLQSENWTGAGPGVPTTPALSATPSMQVLTVRVAFSAQGRDCNVRLSTLVNGP